MLNGHKKRKEERKNNEIFIKISLCFMDKLYTRLSSQNGIYIHNKLSFIFWSSREFLKNVKNLSTQKFLTSTGNLILNLIKFLKIGPKTPNIDGQTKCIIE